MLAYWLPKRKGGRATLSRCWQTASSSCGASGQKLDRAAFLADVPNQAHRGRQAHQPETHQLGGCTIYTCIVTTTQNPDGSPNAGRFWNTRLIVQQDGQWRCEAWQSLKVCTE